MHPCLIGFVRHDAELKRIQFHKLISDEIRSVETELYGICLRRRRNAADHHDTTTAILAGTQCERIADNDLPGMVIPENGT